MNHQPTREKSSARVLLFGVLCLIAAACTSGEPAREAVDTTTTTTTTEAPEEVEVAEIPEIDEAPSTPAGLVVAANEGGEVTLQWDDSRDESVTGYELTRVASIGGSDVFETTETTFTDSELNDGDIFTYSVAAVGSGGTSDRSEPVSVLVGTDTDAPSRPGTPRTVESADGVSLTWRASTDFSGIDRYVVTRILDGETTEIEAPEPMLEDDIAAGQVVTYAVRAVDGAGNESENTRNVTLLSGTAADGVIVVVSAIADPATDEDSTRLRSALLEQGYTVTWFEDEVFDSNITTSDDLVLLVGDVEGQGFDWNLFGTDAHTITLKSIFLVSSGITVDPPKLDRLTQIDYAPPGEDPRAVTLTFVERPRVSVAIPELELIPDLEVWATQAGASDVTVAGLIQTGGELANEREAPGCRAFFPGHPDSLGEQGDAGWDTLVEFVDSVSNTCR